MLTRTITLCVLWSYVGTVHTVQSDQTSRLSVRWHNNFFSSCRQCGRLCHDHAAATENRTKRALQNTPAWHSMLSKAIWRTERMLMRAENNLAYPAPSTDVLCCCSGEGWEVRGERRGGGCGAAGEVLASGWWLSPSSEHQLPLTHTHICWHSCVSTLYALTYSTSVPPELQSLLSVFNKDFFPVWCQHYSLFFHAGASCLCQICPAVTVWHLPSPLHPLWCLTDCSIQPLVSVWLMMQLWTTTALELKLIRAVERHSVKQQRVLKGCER